MTMQSELSNLAIQNTTYDEYIHRGPNLAYNWRLSRNEWYELNRKYIFMAKLLQLKRTNATDDYDTKLGLKFRDLYMKIMMGIKPACRSMNQRTIEHTWNKT